MSQECWKMFNSVDKLAYRRRHCGIGLRCLYTTRDTHWSSAPEPRRICPMCGGNKVDKIIFKKSEFSRISSADE